MEYCVYNIMRKEKSSVDLFCPDSYIGLSCILLTLSDQNIIYYYIYYEPLIMHTISHFPTTNLQI